MKFGLIYNTGIYGADPGNMAAIARHAEACGFESFYVAEHIALYPGATGGGIEFPASLAVADPLECLSFVAALHPVAPRDPMVTTALLTYERCRATAIE